MFPMQARACGLAEAISDSNIQTLNQDSRQPEPELGLLRLVSQRLKNLLVDEPRMLDALGVVGSFLIITI